MKVRIWSATLVVGAVAGAIVYGQSGRPDTGVTQSLDRTSAFVTAPDSGASDLNVGIPARRISTTAATDPSPSPAAAAAASSKANLPPIIDGFDPLLEKTIGAGDRAMPPSNAATSFTSVEQPVPARRINGSSLPPSAASTVATTAPTQPTKTAPNFQTPSSASKSPLAGLPEPPALTSAKQPSATPQPSLPQQAKPEQTFSQPQPHATIKQPAASTSSMRLVSNSSNNPAAPPAQASRPATGPAAPKQFSGSPLAAKSSQPLPHEAAQRDHHIVAASHEIMNGSRELMDAGRVYAQANTPAINQANTPAINEQGNPQRGPALSNYYGDVTINYIVSPNGANPTVTPISFNMNQPGAPETLPAPGMMPPPEFGPGPYGPGPYGPACGPAVPPPFCGCECCCCYHTSHCFGAFAEALYLRPSNVDVQYAREQLGCDPASAVPTGAIGSVNPDDSLGYRVGFVFPCCDYSSVAISYMWWGNDTTSTINTTVPGASLASLVTFPSLANCGANSQSATATYDLYIEAIDLDYRHMWCGGCGWVVNWFGGVRWARLEQQLLAQQNIGGGAGLATITADIDFDGIGMGAGLDFERRATRCGLLCYGRLGADFLAGTFAADYSQTNQFDIGVPIGNSIEDYRLVTVLKGELGLGWSSRCGRVRLTGGYQVNSWFNMLLLNNYLDSVQAGSFDVGCNSSFGLNGLVSRVELRF